MPLRLCLPSARRRDCHRLLFRAFGHRVSTFLHPFAPPALPGFDATMGALTPARGCACGLLNLAHIPCSLPRRSLHFTGITFRALRLQTPHRLLRSLCHLSCQRRRLPAHRGSGLRLSIGSSPVGTAESSSCHYGLPVRLALLPTPPRDDAVTVGYRTETGIPEGDLHLSDVARLWTHDGRDKLGHDGEKPVTSGAGRPKAGRGGSMHRLLIAAFVALFAMPLACRPAFPRVGRGYRRRGRSEGHAGRGEHRGLEAASAGTAGGPPRRVKAYGSGFIIDPSGIIVTNPTSSPARSTSR